MAEDDGRETAREVKGNGVGLDPLLPGALYSERQLCALLGVAADTVKAWEAAGLEPLRPGTKQKFFLSDEVMAVFLKICRAGRKGKS